jgi:transcriptional regulator with XRE-family HTH domain
MRLGKQVKAVETPDLNQTVSNELIGLAVRAKRTQLGFDRESAAAFSGISVTALDNIEKGAQGVRLDSILKIMNALGIKMSIQPWEE